MSSQLRLAAELKQILELSRLRRLTFGELLDRLGVKGQVVFLNLLVTPMIQPIPLPGVSTVLSLMTVIIGYQILLHLPPWLPEKYKTRELDSKVLERWLSVGLRAIGTLEKVLRPRSRLYGHLFFVRQSVAVLVMATSLLLALPLPIPFSNFFPAVTIFMLGLGLLEDDGLLYLVGFLLFLISAVYIGIIFFVPWYYTHR